MAEMIIVNGEKIAIYAATTTSDGKIEIDDATDTEAVAFNKRVRECQTINGEF